MQATPSKQFHKIIHQLINNITGQQQFILSI